MVPSKVSNASLIRQLELWGYRKVGNKGDTWTMANPDYKGRRVQVTAPQVHKGNSTVVIRNVYKVVTNGDAEAFWARRTPSNVPIEDAIEEVFDTMARETARKHAEPWYEQTTSEPTVVTTVTDTADSATSKEEPMSNREVQVEPLAAKKRQRGAASKVLQYLHDHPHDHLTAPTIGAALHLEPIVASGALAHLHRLGFAERLVRGTYRLSPSLAADRTVRHQHGGSVQTPAPLTQQAAVAAVAERRPAPTIVPDVPPAEGDDLDAMLELILPEGYRFRPSHLQAMRKWQSATAELLVILRGAS